MKAYSPLVLAVLLIAFFALSALAIIHCEHTGKCSGNGQPDGITCCKGCHSCTFKGCCHCSFTNRFTRCTIPGWRSKRYQGGK